MGVLTRKIQILFSDEQYGLLKRIAAEKGTSVGALVRDAIEKVYLKEIKKRRMEIAERLVRMKLPVGDWEEMEEEIARGAMEE